MPAVAKMRRRKKRGMEGRGELGRACCRTLYRLECAGGEVWTLLCRTKAPQSVLRGRSLRESRKKNIKKKQKGEGVGEEG